MILRKELSARQKRSFHCGLGIANRLLCTTAHAPHSNAFARIPWGQVGPYLGVAAASWATSVHASFVLEGVGNWK